MLFFSFQPVHGKPHERAFFCPFLSVIQNVLTTYNKTPPPPKKKKTLNSTYNTYNIQQEFFNTENQDIIKYKSQQMLYVVSTF